MTETFPFPGYYDLEDALALKQVIMQLSRLRFLLNTVGPRYKTLLYYTCKRDPFLVFVGVRLGQAFLTKNSLFHQCEARF